MTYKNANLLVKADQTKINKKYKISHTEDKITDRESLFSKSALISIFGGQIRKTYKPVIWERNRTRITYYAVTVASRERNI